MQIVSLIAQWRIFFLFASILLNFSLIAQTLPSDFNPDYLKVKNENFLLGVTFHDSLTFRVSLTGSEACCLNMFTQKQMHDYSMKLKVENKSSRTYFVKIPQRAYVMPRGWGAIINSGSCSGSSAYVGIWSKKKTYRIEPGNSESFFIKTKMDYNDYYPISETQHDEWLQDDPRAFEPHCMALSYSIRSYSKKQIVDILNKLNNNANNNSNNNSTGGNNGLDDLIGDLEDDLDDEINNTSPIKNDEQLDEAAKPIITTTTKADDEVSYDIGLCNTFKSELQNWLYKTESMNSSNVKSIMAEMKDYHKRRDLAVAENRLDPKCVEELDKISKDYFDKKMRNLQKEVDKAEREYNQLLQESKTTTKSNTPRFAPSTMTPSFEKSTPSLKNDNFSGGTLKTPTKNGVIPPK